MDVELNTLSDFTKFVVDAYSYLIEEDEYNIVNVFVKKSEIVKVISDLADAFFIGNVKINLYDDYEDEYCITVERSIFGDEMNCYMSKETGKYDRYNCDLAIILDNCNSAILSNIDARMKFYAQVRALDE